jgi:hypothetical protein
MFNKRVWLNGPRRVELRLEKEGVPWHYPRLFGWFVIWLVGWLVGWLVLQVLAEFL